MLDVIIDSDGLSWSAQAPGLARRLGTSLPAADLVAYAIRNLGFVGVARRLAAAHISLRPSCVHPVALAQSIEWAAKQTGTRFVLATMAEDETWKHQVCGSLQQTVRTLIALTQPYEEQKGHLLRQRRDWRGLDDDPAFGPLWKVWQVDGAQTRLARLRPFLRAHLDDRFVVVHACENGDLPIDAYGDGLPLLNGTMGRQRPGTRLQDGMDVRYANWAAKGYLEVHTRDEPLFEGIDVSIKVPRRPPQRTAYRRLILPIRGGDGSRALLSASVLDPRIDLRLELREKS